MLILIENLKQGSILQYVQFLNRFRFFVIMWMSCNHVVFHQPIFHEFCFFKHLSARIIVYLSPASWYFSTILKFSFNTCAHNFVHSFCFVDFHLDLRFPTNTIKHKNIYTDMSVVNVDYMNDNTPALPQLLSSLNDRWFNHVSSFSCSFVASKSYNWENPSSILEIEQDPMHILQTISQGC